MMKKHQQTNIKQTNKFLTNKESPPPAPRAPPSESPKHRKSFVVNHANTGLRWLLIHFFLSFSFSSSSSSLPLFFFGDDRVCELAQNSPPFRCSSVRAVPLSLGVPAFHRSISGSRCSRPTFGYHVLAVPLNQYPSPDFRCSVPP